MRGLGTSLCRGQSAWHVGGWRNATALEQSLGALFGRPGEARGLGLNQVRYNIGGSDTAAGDAHFLRAGGFAQTFLPADGRYDWSADATQRRVVAAAKHRGRST